MGAVTVVLIICLDSSYNEVMPLGFLVDREKFSLVGLGGRCRWIIHDFNTECRWLLVITILNLARDCKHISIPQSYNFKSVVCQCQH